MRGRQGQALLLWASWKGRHPGDPEFQCEEIERSTAGSLLNKPADKRDYADVVVTMCVALGHKIGRIGDE